jgi:hypothetical protein
MKCLDCPLKYTGQTGRTFHNRYKEHIESIRTNNGNSEHPNHILNTGHTYGTTTDTIDIRRKEKKGKHINTLEKYHIHKIRKDRLHMYNTYIHTYYPIFETLHQIAAHMPQSAT